MGKKAFLFELFLCSFVFFGCIQNPQPLRIQTDRPEFAILADQYQAISGNPPLEITLIPDGEYANTASSNTDLVIASGLYNPISLSNLVSQKELLNNPQIAKESYYPFTFLGSKDDFRLTTLSWDLPAIISSIPNASQDFSESVFLNLDNLREKGAQFNAKKIKSLRRLGFSPLYSDPFLYLVCQYQGASLSGDGRGFPQWNDGNLVQALSYLDSWSNGINDGVAQENAFLAKFCYDPVFQLVNNKVFSFAYCQASDFFRQPTLVQGKLSLYWPSWAGRLRILDNFVAAGIPRHSSRKEESLALIAWLLKEQVQNQAITDSLRIGLHSFGYLGGFSTLRTVTEKTIPLHYPQARLKIPPENQLDFPVIQGIRWDVFKNEVLKPWIRASVAGKIDPTNLTELRNQWLLHMGLNP